jgi:hypothetical protein
VESEYLRRAQHHHLGHPACSVPLSAVEVQIRLAKENDLDLNSHYLVTNTHHIHVSRAHVSILFFSGLFYQFFSFDGLFHSVFLIFSVRFQL